MATDTYPTDSPTLAPAPAVSGFTLVELLVVIGIIAVLIAILLPTLSAARRQAQVTQCAARMRDVVSGAIGHANDKRGYLPLTGKVSLRLAAGANPPRHVPAALNDSNRVRYSYGDVIGFNVRDGLLPFHVAVAPYLNRAFRVPVEDTGRMLEYLGTPGGPWNYVRCPASTLESGPRPTGGGVGVPTTDLGAVIEITFPPNGLGGYTWLVETDYVYNEGVLGFVWDSRVRRLRGHLSAIKRPSETMILMDGRASRPRSGSGVRWSTVAPRDGFTLATTFGATNYPPTQPRAYTLAENFDNATGDNDRSLFDLIRHRGRVNVAFADGHVETRRLTSADLASVLTLPPP